MCVCVCVCVCVYSTCVDTRKDTERKGSEIKEAERATFLCKKEWERESEREEELENL